MYGITLQGNFLAAEKKISGTPAYGQALGTEELRALIQDCIAQDVRAQKRLYEHYSPMLYGIIRRYSYDSSKADEILNEAFFKIFTSLEKFSFKGAFEGWMRRIVIHAVTDHFRKYVKKDQEHLVDVEEPIVQVNSDAVGQLSYKELLKMVHELPDTQRAVFNLYVFESLSHKEIADHLDLTEGNSRWHLNDARRRLKEKIKSVQ